jgi:hypothetical protein
MLLARAWLLPSRRAFATRSAARTRLLASATPSRDGGVPSMPPEVPSMSEEELHASIEGGASRYAFGEFGASGPEMQAFWQRRGMPHETCARLARRAARVGGVWGDPPTLTARCEDLQAMLPLRPLAHIVSKYPDALAFRSSTLRAKLQLLSAALPRIDVLRMVANSPSILARSPEMLRERTAAFLPLLPRKDMPQLLADHPDLLRFDPAEMAARSDALHKAFSLKSLLTADRERVAYLLRNSASRLARLQLLDTNYPGLRHHHLRDSKALRMSDHSFSSHFTRAKPSRR